MEMLPIAVALDEMEDKSIETLKKEKKYNPDFTATSCSTVFIFSFLTHQDAGSG